MHEVTRLRKGKEFDLIFRTGTRISGELVRVLYLKGEDSAIRFGCAVGKRQGKAHIRNRGRRVLREAFRTIQARLTSRISLVLGLTDKGLASKTPEIARDLERVLKRRKLIS